MHKVMFVLSIALAVGGCAGFGLIATSNPLEKLMEAELATVTRVYNDMLNDNRDVETIVRENRFASQSQCLAVKGLIQMTMGCPQPVYNGGLVHATVRHFDPDRRRSGLPPGVAALVDELKADRVGVHLVNTSHNETRRVLVQSGGYGEHTFESVSFRQGDVERTLPVNGKHFEVMLPPSTSIRVSAGLRRVTNQPSYAFPWHGDRVPAPAM